jgi:Mg-chelatase subunit ChlD
VAQWRAWWKDKGDEFKVPSPGDLATAAQAREVRRLRQRTVVAQDAEFFGVPIESHRAIFIIDTSGSMVEAVPGRMVGNREAARIEVAKEELQQCLKALDEHALFNIFSFSSGVGRWLESGIATANAKSRAEAIEFVERLGAGGATNLYDTLKMAFEDPDVDTIYVLSDGEPTAGEVTDPHQIREDVKRWNQHRRIVIHTIAVGGSLEVLEWLAKDSGGSYVRFG